MLSNVSILLLVGGGNFREFLDDIDTSPSNGGDENVTIDMENN